MTHLEKAGREAAPRSAPPGYDRPAILRTFPRTILDPPVNDASPA